MIIWNHKFMTHDFAGSYNEAEKLNFQKRFSFLLEEKFLCFILTGIPNEFVLPQRWRGFVIGLPFGRIDVFNAKKTAHSFSAKG